MLWQNVPNVAEEIYALSEIIRKFFQRKKIPTLKLSLQVTCTTIYKIAIFAERVNGFNNL